MKKKTSTSLKKRKAWLKEHWLIALFWLDARPVRSCMFLALALNFVVECLSRRSVLKVLVHLVTQPYLFLLGALIIFPFLCLSLLFPKRRLVLGIVSFIWMGLGITDYVLLFYRVTPLAFIDFELLPSVFSILRVYLTFGRVLAIGVCFMILVAALVLLAIHSPKMKVHIWRAVAVIAAAVGVTAGAIALGLYSKTLPKQIANLADAYQEYGFVYCFSASVVDRGISKPSTYETEIDTLADTLSEEEKEPEQQLPTLEQTEQTEETEPEVNVIFLQLESFIDPNELTNYAYSEDPCPTFSRLRRTCPSGYLTVPSIGAGTANTEFEVISGMSLQFFGTGEYPYKTVLRDNTCETVCYNLKEQGYTATAIHNNKASFYDRNEVFSHLGFDNFISLEYMNDVEYNPQGWACDKVLTNQILTTLRTTEGRDVIYTISVQAHGKYPDTHLENDTGTIEVYGEDDPVMNSRITYYVNQVAEVDSFLAELTSALTDFDEPVLLVMYGDHLPSLDILQENTASQNLFQTEYVIWSNYGQEADLGNLAAYQLSANILGLLGYDNGNLTKLHQNSSDAYNYLEELELLEYDMLYGDQVVYGGENPYEPTDLHMGVTDIVLQTVAFQDGRMYAFGNYFTPYSVVCVNGRQMETHWMNRGMLYVDDLSIEDVRYVSVEQVSEDSEVLSETDQLSVE